MHVKRYLGTGWSLYPTIPFVAARRQEINPIPLYFVSASRGVDRFVLDKCHFRITCTELAVGPGTLSNRPQRYKRLLFQSRIG